MTDPCRHKLVRSDGPSLAIFGIMTGSAWTLAALSFVGALQPAKVTAGEGFVLGTACVVLGLITLSGAFCIWEAAEEPKP